jgi:trk system potassium uptake protein TrkA
MPRCSVGGVHFVIMGCGRVGSSLALSLENQGHDVAVIDQEESAFRRLGSAFEGRRVTGVGFDRDTLHEAGITDAYAFAAVSSGDNSNILAARVARETFGVEHVVARIYDPGRAEVYQRLGIPTVATVKWTSDQMLRRLLPQGHVPELVDPSGKVVIAEVTVNPGWVGRLVSELESSTGTRAAYLTRLGSGILPNADTVFQEGDLLHVAAIASELPAAERTLDSPPAPSGH